MLSVQNVTIRKCNLQNVTDPRINLNPQVLGK